MCTYLCTYKVATQFVADMTQRTSAHSLHGILFADDQHTHTPAHVKTTHAFQSCVSSVKMRWFL